MKHHDPAAIRRAKIIRTIVMVFLCVLSLLPFYLMFVNGTRTSNEVKSGISFCPGAGTQTAMDAGNGNGCGDQPGAE